MSDPDAARALAAELKAAAARAKAERGDLAPLVALLRDPGARLDQATRATIADALEGKLGKPGHRPPDRLKLLRQHQCACFFLMLTIGLGIRDKRALGRLAGLYRKKEDTLGRWIEADRKRQGPERWAAMEAKAPEWPGRWRDAFEPEMARLLFASDLSR